MAPKLMETIVDGTFGGKKGAIFLTWRRCGEEFMWRPTEMKQLDAFHG